jgi:type II secretory pathway pseudopilin PulG
VIAIIAVLIALLLPAVQQAREAARRSQCKNNFKQMGLAMHNYLDAHGGFPPGALAGFTTATGTGNPAAAHRWANGINWRVSILPYLDQAPLYNTLNFSGFSFQGPTTWASGGSNMSLVGLVVPGFLCPSSNIDPAINTAPPNPQYDNPQKILAAHYVGVSGATPDPGGRVGVCNAVSYGIACGNGPMRPNQLTRIRDLTDGTSNCIVIAEQSGLVGLTAISANYGGGWNGVGQVEPASRASGHYFYAGITAVRFAPNARTATATASSQPYESNTILNSFHTGGIHVMTGDGAVRFTSDNVNLAVLLAACSMDDQVVAGEF